MTKTAWAWVGIFLVSLLLGPAATAQKTEEKEKASIWMKKKSEYAQRLLVDLVRADFSATVTDAKEIQFFGYLEKNDRASVPGYKRQLGNFESAIEELIKCAEAKNIQGMTLAFQELTISCVQCHQVLRQR